MYLLYLDESGNPDSPEDRNFVLAGVAVFERVTYFLSQALDDVQAKHLPGIEPVEFHATDIRSGKGFWRRTEKAKREAIVSDLGSTLVNANREGVVLFGAVIEKSAALHGENVIRRATEEICIRFDNFLKRKYYEGNPQRGRLVFAESTLQKRQRVWVQDFRKLGTQWGVIANLSDIPYFALARETRLLQAADLVSHALYLLYERNDDSVAKPFLHRFDQRDGVLHGLVHLTPNKATCTCPRCDSERRRTEPASVPGTPS